MNISYSKQQKQSIQNHPQQNRIQIFQPEIPSPYKEKYDSYFSKTPLTNISDFQFQLSKNKIRYTSCTFHSGSNIEVVSFTEKSSIVVLSLTILNIIGQSPAKGETSQKSERTGLLQQLNKGGNGEIFLSIGLEGKFFAIKSIQYCHKNQKNPRHDLLENAIVEYCFYKLFSVLKIGPHIDSYFGFDLIVYSSTVEFAMELCTHEKNIDIEHLKNNLRMMYSLNIIHGDIKPANIMWSWTYNKFVFVDFGYSRCIRGKPGTLTSSKYFGTLAYSYKQMLHAYMSGCSYKLDLYYNDAFGLIKISQEIKSMKLSFKQNNEVSPYKKAHLSNEQKRKIYLNYLFNFLLKKAIYDRDFTIIESFTKKYKQYQFSRQILQLFIQVPASKRMNTIFKYLVRNYNIEGQERVIQISKYYSGKKLLISPLQTTINLGYRFRDKVDLEEQQKYLSEAERFMLLIYREDITDRQKIKKLINLQKIKQKKLKISDPKLILEFYVDLVRNIFITKQQILYIFEKAKQLLEIKEWDKIEKPQLEVFIKAWQIRRAASQKFSFNIFQQYSLDGFFQIKNDQFHNLQEYEKQMFQVFEKFLKDLKKSKFLTSKNFTSYAFQKSSQVDEQILQIIRKQKNPSQLYKIYLEQKSHEKKYESKLFQKLNYFQKIRKTKVFIFNFQDFSINKCKQYASPGQTLNNFLQFELSLFHSCFEDRNFLIIFFLEYVDEKFKICLVKGDQQSFKQLVHNYEKFIEIYVQQISQTSNVILGYNLIKILQNKIYNLKRQFEKQLGNIILESLITLYDKFHESFDENSNYQYSYYFFDKFDQIMTLKREIFKIQPKIKKQLFRVIRQVLIPNLEKYFTIRNHIQNQTNKARKYFILYCLIQLKTTLKIITIEQAIQIFHKILQENYLLIKMQDHTQFQFISSALLFIYTHRNEELTIKYASLTQKMINIIQIYLQKQKIKITYPKIFQLIEFQNAYYALDKNKYKLYNQLLQFNKIQHFQLDIISIYSKYMDYFFIMVFKENGRCMKFEFLERQIDYFQKIVEEKGGLQCFCERYGQAIIFCQFFLRYLSYVSVGNNTQIYQVIRFIKIGNLIMKHQPSSFLNSRFKIVCSLVTLKFMKYIFPENKRRLQLAHIKILRNKQYLLKNNTEMLVNKNITQSNSITYKKHIKKLKYKLTKIQQNKTKKCQTEQNVNNQKNQRIFTRLLNEQYLIDFIQEFENNY